MTNLLEKSLIIGFGIFTLIIFLTIVTPFFVEISEFEGNNDEETTTNQNNTIIIDQKINLLVKFLENKKIIRIKPLKIDLLTYNENYISLLTHFTKMILKKHLYKKVIDLFEKK